MPQDSYLDFDHLDVAAEVRAYDPQFMRSISMTDALSYQCLLRQGDMRAVAWIEERGARAGVRVEIKGEDGLWDVVEVYQPPRTAAWLHENASRARKGLPSIR